MNIQSLWTDTAPPPSFPKLNGRIEVDVLVVGGGITGLTTAWLLQQEGRSVAVIDQKEIGSGDTSHTTAHVTFVTDMRANELASRAGKEQARILWHAGQAAMNQIAEIVAELQIDCGLTEIPGYLFAAPEKDLEKEIESLKKDAELAEEFGFDAEYIESDPLFHRPAVRFPNQMKFHPLKYVNALALALKKAGGLIFSNTSGEVDSDKHELTTDGGVIAYDKLVAATHVPIQGERGMIGAALFQTKLAAYSSYVIEAKIDPQPGCLMWDTNDPYRYYRFDQDDAGGSVIIGGEDHKTGQENPTDSSYERLEKALFLSFPKAKITHRWSGQVIETTDGLPYIGEVGDCQYLATGFSGNGMTLGTFSAMLIRDLIVGKDHSWKKIFDPHRKSIAGAWDYLVENKDFPAYFIAKHLAPASDKDLSRCHGQIEKVDGKKRAVYCDEHGHRTELSPICPHMGCIVGWNSAEKTWDCPCHGSRFGPTGELLSGPAESGLEPAEAAK